MGERIRKAREEKSLSQAQLAQLIGVKSGAVISNWEKDLNKPDAEKMVSLCEALHITASYLLDYYGKSTPPASDSQERRLLDAFRQLNPEGREKVLVYADDIVSSGKYVKTDSQERVKLA